MNKFLYLELLSQKVVELIPHSVCPEFGTSVVPSQTVGQLVVSPAVGFMSFPVHIVHEFTLL